MTVEEDLVGDRLLLGHHVVEHETAVHDVGIPERCVDVNQDSYSKNRLGQGPTKFYESAGVIKGDAEDVDRITNHVLGDACTPGNAKECTFETVRPVVEHSMTGDLDDLLS